MVKDKSNYLKEKDMVKNLKIGTRLLMCFGLILLLLMCVAGTGYWGVKEVESVTDTMLDTEAQLAEHAAGVDVSIVSMRRHEKDILLNLVDA